MSLLTALIAFAVTMIVLSTVVSAGVQVLHNIRRARQRHLALLLSVTFDEVLWPRFRKVLTEAHRRDTPDVAKSKVDDALGRSVKPNMLDSIAVLLSKWYANPNTTKPEKVLGWLFAAVFGFLGASWLIHEDAGVLVIAIGVFALVLADRHSVRDQEDTPHQNAERNNQSLPNIKDVIRDEFVRQMVVVPGATSTTNRATTIKTTDFASQLGRTEIGQYILSIESEGDRKTIITEICRRFDELGDGSRASFAELSRTWAVRLAFLTAFVMNVDAIALMQRFIDDPELSATVSQFDEEKLASFETELAALETKKIALENVIQGIAGQPPQSTVQELQNIQQQIEIVLERMQVEVQSLASLGVPVGWDFFPMCLADNSAELDERCNAIGETKDSSLLKWAEENFTETEFWWKPTVEAAAWVQMRWIGAGGDFIVWLIGAGLGGALIGLGGPFWFDLFRRLSVLASLARSLGFGGGGSGAKDSENADESEEDGNKGKPKSNSPESDHLAENAVEALLTSAKAKALLTSKDNTKRKILNPDGTHHVPT